MDMKIGRRKFLGSALGAVAVGGCTMAKGAAKMPEYDFKWIDLVHFGMKMWGDIPKKPNRNSSMTKLLTDEEYAAIMTPENMALDRLHFDEPFW